MIIREEMPAKPRTVDDEAPNYGDKLQSNLSPGKNMMSKTKAQELPSRGNSNVVPEQSPLERVRRFNKHVNSQVVFDGNTPSAVPFCIGSPMLACAEEETTSLQILSEDVIVMLKTSSPLLRLRQASYSLGSESEFSLSDAAQSVLSESDSDTTVTDN